jgi:hypothetical protein
MICYSLTLCRVAPDRATAFMSTCRAGGLWHSLAKELPGHIGTSVLAHSHVPNLLLVLHYWSSAAAGVTAEASPMGRLLLDVLARIAKQGTTHLGLFTFPSDGSCEQKSELSLNDGQFDS